MGSSPDDRNTSATTLPEFRISTVGRSVPEWQKVVKICMLALIPLGVLSGRLRLYSFSG